MIIKVSIQDKMASFDLDGRLHDSCMEILSLVDDKLHEIIDDYWGVNQPNASLTISGFDNTQLRISSVQACRNKLSNITSDTWAEEIGKAAYIFWGEGISLTTLSEAYFRGNRKMIEILVRRIGADTERVVQLTQAVLAVQAIEQDIVNTVYVQAAIEASLKQKTIVSAEIQSQIGQVAEETANYARSLGGQAAETVKKAQGMLGKASEVAAASEQSAIAMREAAQTAAGLIHAIESARDEVEAAARIAERAGQEANLAVESTDILSDQSRSIESILGLIRDIAGQTNMLALNATIEAARAGEAGRGFAVVAQEVKSLANQTAGATDEIAAKIGAIQEATEKTVSSNQSIRGTVEEVKLSAQRIREAMEHQAQTVTMITASVDETALAADLMSNTIATIRSDTENVVTDLAALDENFGRVNIKISELDESSRQFIRSLAA